jgi:hypothetical protein
MNIANFGYSVVTPIDFVLELLPRPTEARQVDDFAKALNPLPMVRL